ncbi:MAG: RIP metalloprotease RseP [Spirochaetaceae bacterium]|nr:RIP metalloprotease RseP [Spirochaetaceae bacterium]
MIVVKVALGIVGLGIVVLIHELGHFIVARLSGIEVEAFSIGWGKPVLRKKIGAVEYRLGMFPVGGYCKMKGENDFQEAWENSKNALEPSRGSFFSARPWQRILVAFAGPFFNFVFAVFVLSALWGRGIEIKTVENKIVLLADLDGRSYPSDQGGLQTGDRIIEIKGREIHNYRDIQENIALNPDQDLPVTVLRNGATVTAVVHPGLDKTGAGKIGVYYWADPIVRALEPGGPAEKAGLMPGDRILRVDGEDFPYTVALHRIFKDRRPAEIPVEYRRNGAVNTVTLSGVEYLQDLPNLGIEYPVVQYKTPALSPPRAFAKGGAEALKIFAVSAKSLGLLFKKGVDLTESVSGPARITYMLGDIAAEGFEESVGTGFSSALNFLALISIALCLMNLLPVPILDGGLIVLFLVELIRRRPLNPRAVSAFQTIGMVIIVGLMIFGIFNDILFFTGQ